MSLPERQDLGLHQAPTRGDVPSRLDFVFRRLEIERLMQEAHILGRAVVKADGGIRVAIGITPLFSFPFNALGQRTVTHESACFDVVRQTESSTYQIRHDITTQVEDQAPLRLRREFVLTSDHPGPSDGMLGQTHGNYSATIESLMGEAAGVPVDGAAFDGSENVAVLAAMATDTAEVKIFQLSEVAQLTQRALTAVRSGLTRQL